MSSQKLLLSGVKRTVVGRKVKSLRKQGLVPANVFGKKVKSLAISVKSVDFRKIFSKAGATGIIYLEVEGEKDIRPVLVSSAQKSPLKGTLLHIDFRQVDLTQKVKAEVPIKIIGESLAVKDKNGVLVSVLSQVMVEALPADLPEFLEISIQGLTEIGQSLHIKDINLDKSKVKIEAAEDETVVIIQEPKKEEIEVKPVAEVAVVEGEEGVKVEGEKPAVGKLPQAEKPVPGPETKNQTDKKD
ncbi:50S ribosomal protein L25 [Candidatus Collierbacteria bacterium]|nr:50S ribosomal protein L25 [Candidatus Collierbacteria bacterium]